MTIKKRVAIALTSLSLLLTQACSSELDVPSDALQGEVGEVVIGVTDAPGDFTAYEVNVKSLKLIHQNGAVVETLPRSAEIDFTQYIELTEFLTVATVPRGTYVKGSMVLDYTNASIFVEDENGNSVEANSVVDEQGQTVTTMEMEFSFDNANRLLVAPGIPAHLTLDFDLLASNTVDLAATEGVQVIVEPVLLAELSREGGKSHRARGALRSVDIDSQAFSLFLRPGRNPLGHSQRVNHLTVLTDDDTHFNIDNVTYDASTGLSALAGKTRLSAVVAHGSYRFNPVRFVASEVYAGSSVPDGNKDVIRGTVISRAGDDITVKGALLKRASGIAAFNVPIVVNLADSTNFSRQASMESVSAGDVSVGQRINAVGSLVAREDDSYQFATDQGSVHLLLTFLGGALVENSDHLTLALSTINGRTPSIMEFSGTGVSTQFDADPDAYEVDKNGLSTNHIEAASTLKIAGHAKPFGQAPADFIAQSIVDVSALPATLRVSWQEPVATSIDTSTMESLVLDLAGAGRFHHVSQAGAKLDLKSQENPSIVEFADGPRTHFVLVQHGTRVVHSESSTFLADLDTRVAEGALPAGLEAWGRYDNPENILSAFRTVVRLR